MSERATARRAIVTRAAKQAAPLARGLEALGFQVILSPAIRFEEPEDWSAFDGAVTAAGPWDWVILTSANGVRAVTARLSALGKDWSVFGASRLAAIGPATARALEAEGLSAALVPEEYRAEGILEAFGRKPLDGVRVLLARAQVAREILPEELQRRGAMVTVAPVYRTVACPPAGEAVEALASGAGPSLVVIFTSPSTVTHFVEGLPGPARRGLERATLASIGPVTSAALRERGLSPAVEPAAYTVPALLEALGPLAPPA